MSSDSESELPASGSDEGFSDSSAELTRESAAGDFAGSGFSQAGVNIGLHGVGSAPVHMNFFDAFQHPHTARDGDADSIHNSADVAEEFVDSLMANDESAQEYDEYDSSGDRQLELEHHHDAPVEVDGSLRSGSDEYEHVDKVPRADEGYESGDADNDDGEVGPDARSSSPGSESLDSVFTAAGSVVGNSDSEVASRGELVELVDDQLDLEEDLDHGPTAAEELPADDVPETGSGRVDISSMTDLEIRLAFVDRDTPITGHVHEYDIALLRNIDIKPLDYSPAGRASAGDAPATAYCRALPRQPEGMSIEQQAARASRLPPRLESPGRGSTKFLRESALMGAGRAALLSTGRDTGVRIRMSRPPASHGAVSQVKLIVPC